MSLVVLFGIVVYAPRVCTFSDLTSRGMAPELPHERATTVAAPPERWFLGDRANPTGVDLLGRFTHAYHYERQQVLLSSLPRATARPVGSARWGKTW